MIDLIKEFSPVYGIDWLSAALGLYGMFLTTRKNATGFIFTALACLCGLFVAYISQQNGYVISNAIYILLMSKGYMDWKQPKAATALTAQIAT